MLSHVEEIRKIFNLTPESMICIKQGEEDDKCSGAHPSSSPISTNFYSIRFLNSATGRWSQVFQCNEGGCRKVMSKWLNMCDHLRYHAGDKPHYCPVKGCGKSFTQQSNMRKHLCQTHKISSLICFYCERSFRRHLSLLRHFKEHDQEEVRAFLKTDDVVDNSNSHLEDSQDQMIGMRGEGNSPMDPIRPTTLDCK